MRLIFTAILAMTPLLARDSKPELRLNKAAAVFSEVIATADKGIPEVGGSTTDLIILVTHTESTSETHSSLNEHSAHERIAVGSGQ